MKFTREVGIDEKLSVTQSVGVSQKELMKAFVRNCPFLVPRSIVTRRQEKERGTGPRRGHAGAALG